MSNFEQVSIYFENICFSLSIIILSNKKAYSREGVLLIFRKKRQGGGKTGISGITTLLKCTLSQMANKDFIKIHLMVFLFPTDAQYFKVKTIFELFLLRRVLSSLQSVQSFYDIVTTLVC